MADPTTRLPEALRVPVLLCYLEGLTLDEAAAGIAETTRTTKLSNGATSMTALRLQLCLLFVVALGCIDLGVAAPQNPDITPKAAAVREPRDAVRPATPAAQPPAATKAEFEEVTIAIKPSFRSNRLPETIKVTGDGTCLYKVPGRPADGDVPAWSGAVIIHKFPPERLRELGALLKGTDWLANEAKEMLQLHHPEYAIALKRDGKTAQITLKGESKTYGKLLHFFESVAAQEYLLYRLEWVPAAMGEGRRELDGLIGAELGEPSARSPYTIDLTRYTPWATRLVRMPFEKQADDVRTAIRLVGLLKLASEQEYLADLASDRDRDVRTAVAHAVGRLGGEKAVPILRKLVRSTGEDAAWELIRLGPAAVPTIIEAIRDGVGEEDMSYEWLIRAYVDYWKDVPKPLDAKIVAVVRTSMANPKVKAHRTTYHVEFLKLVAESDKKE